MSVFVDTSALYALLSRTDENHRPAAAAFPGLRRRGSLITHNYVVVEAAALVHRRLGGAAVRALLDELLAPIEVLWVDPGLHAVAQAAFLAGARRRGISLVDRVSFETMRRHGIGSAFAFDPDFASEGFELIP